MPTFVHVLTVVAASSYLLKPIWKKFEKKHIIVTFDDHFDHFDERYMKEKYEDFVLLVF